MTKMGDTKNLRPNSGESPCLATSLKAREYLRKIGYSSAHRVGGQAPALGAGEAVTQPNLVSGRVEHTALSFPFLERHKL